MLVARPTETPHNGTKPNGACSLPKAPARSKISQKTKEIRRVIATARESGTPLPDITPRFIARAGKFSLPEVRKLMRHAGIHITREMVLRSVARCKERCGEPVTPAKVAREIGVPTNTLDTWRYSESTEKPLTYGELGITKSSPCRGSETTTDLRRFTSQLTSHTTQSLMISLVAALHQRGSLSLSHALLLSASITTGKVSFSELVRPIAKIIGVKPQSLRTTLTGRPRAVAEKSPGIIALVEEEFRRRLAAERSASSRGQYSRACSQIVRLRMKEFTRRPITSLLCGDKPLSEEEARWIALLAGRKEERPQAGLTPAQRRVMQSVIAFAELGQPWTNSTLGNAAEVHPMSVGQYLYGKPGRPGAQQELMKLAPKDLRAEVRAAFSEIKMRTLSPRRREIVTSLLDATPTRRTLPSLTDDEKRLLTAALAARRTDGKLVISQIGLPLGFRRDMSFRMFYGDKSRPGICAKLDRLAQESALPQPVVTHFTRRAKDLEAGFIDEVVHILHSLAPQKRTLTGEIFTELAYATGASRPLRLHRSGGRSAPINPEGKQQLLRAYFSGQCVAFSELYKWIDVPGRPTSSQLTHFFRGRHSVHPPVPGSLELFKSLASQIAGASEFIRNPDNAQAQKNVRMTVSPRLLKLGATVASFRDPRLAAQRFIELIEEEAQPTERSLPPRASV